MSCHSIAVRLLCGAAFVAAAACSESTSPTSRQPVAVLQAAQAPDLSTLARDVPGFGGLFLDHGVPTVYLTDPLQRGPLEHPPGVLVGVERGASHANVRSLAARRGVPAEAIVTRDVDPIQYAATLQDQVRPVVAGLQIHFGNFLCSIGFNAVSGGQNSFVTASHCTNRQGGVEGTLYYQSLSSQPNSFIGTEVADPVYFRGGVCPKHRVCRYSDTARAAYAAGVPFTLGGIAQTSGPNDGSLDITGSFAVTSEGTAVVGDVVNKVGRTTGWTQGTVTNTCVNTGVSGTKIVQLCQTFVSAGVGAGDSGSDIFGLTGGSSVQLLGILWGGNSGGTQFVYSPINQVEQELGPLTTF